MSRRTWLIIAFAIVSIVWGSTYLGIRVALESYPPFLLGAVRFVLAGAVLLVVARVRGEAMPSRREWVSAAVTGGLFFVIGNGLVNVAEATVSSGLASVLVATMPLWMTVFGRMFGATASPREIAGVLLGLSGVVILNLGGDLRASPMGAVICLLAPLGWSLGSLASQRLPLPAGMMRTATQMLTGGVGMFLVSVLLHEHAAVPTVRTTLAVAYLCVFGSLIGFTAYSYLLRHTRPAVASSYAYVNPVIAVVLGIAMAGEKFGLQSGVGAVVVLAAVALVQKRVRASGRCRRPSVRRASTCRGSGLVAAGSERRV
jgi:drug/metabolite transporter (DMT)-like permease